MNVSLQGFGEQVATFEAASGVKPGIPVKLSANGTVAPCGAGDIPCGVAVNVRGEYAGVQLAGYVRLPYTGTLTLGFVNILGDPGGKIKAAASGTSGCSVLITDIDSATSTAGLIL